MKSSNWPNYVIASTVVGCSLALLAGLTIVLYGVQWTKGGRTLQIEFRDSTGIKAHSPVRYAGASAGKVIKIRYLTPDERANSKNRSNAIRVTVQLDDDVPPIPSDVVAGLASETILGEKFIALSAGSLDSPPLADGAVIQGKDVISFDALAQSAQAALQDLTEIMTKLNQDYPTLVPRVAELLAQGNSLLRQGSNFIQNANGTISDAGGVVTKFRADYADLIAKLDSVLTQVKGVATNADSTIQQAGSFVVRADTLIETNQENLQRIIHELRIVSQDLKVITTYTKALTGTLGEKPSRVIWGRKKAQLPTEQEILESTNAVPIIRPKR